jgi:energy-coupling factor transporter transmembrane protein EcfT
MILTFVTIGVLILGIIFLIIGLKYDFSGGEVIAGISTALIVTSGVMGLIISFILIGNQFPSIQNSLQLEYEETYNALVASLKTDKTNVIILTDKVAEYNTNVKKHYARLEDPWVNWFEPTINVELQTINIEDYL